MDDKRIAEISDAFFGNQDCRQLCRQAIRTALRESGEDAARLDHIVAKRATVYAASDIMTGETHHWVFVDETAKDRRGIIGDTIRQSIDAARESEHGK